MKLTLTIEKTVDLPAEILMDAMREMQQDARGREFEATPADVVAVLIKRGDVVLPNDWQLKDAKI